MKKHTVITISREFGSGGRRIGELAAARLGIPYYDKALIELSAEESGLSPDFVKNNEQKITNSFLFNLATTSNYYPHIVGMHEGLRPEDSLFFAQVKMIREIADKGSCVIVGRCADYILRDREDSLHIFIYADGDSKLARATQHYGLTRDNAQSEMKKRDKLRSNHYNYYTGQTWGDRKNYHLCINSGFLGEQRSVDAICAIANGD